jgi:transcription initiation factor TFIIH subunit 4
MNIPAAAVGRLYSDPTSAMAIYRMLGIVAQYTVRRLLLVRGAIPFTALRAWHCEEFKSQQNVALLQLKKLDILQGKTGEVWLNEGFQRSLVRAFSGDLKVAEEEGPSSIRKDANVSEERWETLLYTLVTGGKDVKTGKNLFNVLFGAGLITNERSLSITSQGFQFLLANRSTQLWTLLIQYFTMVEELGADVVDCIIAICRLSLQRRESIAPVNIPKEMIIFLTDDLGLLRREGKDQYFVTELAEHLVPNSGLTTAESGYIVIETNYKVYAYTTSPLQIAILGLFVQLKDRLANMIHGQLTAPSVGAALSKGINADQLVTFLKSHMHPVVQKAGLSLPPVVEDQIHLWERDRNRLKSGEGYLYGQFPNDGAFKRTVTEATRLHAILYVNYSKMLLVVKGEAHPAVKAFIKADTQ